MSLVSIVIPAYNQGRYLRRAIESALAQTHADVELVIVNDGLTDDTARVIAEFEDRANLTVIHQANAGLPAARNRGLAAARGAFVCFLDSDDYLAPAHAARLSAPLDADASIGFAYCDIQTVGPDDEPNGTFSVGESRKMLSGDILPSLVIGGYFPPHAVLVRRSLLDALGGFGLDLGGNADYELWLRLSAAGHRAVYVNDKLAAYRTYDESMSRDLAHMRTTRALALDRVARRYPDRFARAVASLQDLAVDLHAANTWLAERWEGARRALDGRKFAGVWSLLDHLDEATLVEGTPNRLGVWNAEIGGSASRAIFLHPASTLQAKVPGGQAGRLMTSVAIHPDAWSKPDAGTCQFSITVDGKAAASLILDPRHREADRRWVEVAMDVAASSTGEHTLAIETRAVGKDFYCWALFKDVKFGWTAA